MKIAVVGKDIIVEHNKQLFLLHILEGDKYIINDFSWNQNVLEGYEDVLIYKNAEIYYAEWVDSNLILHQVVDYDNLAKYLYNLLPEGLGSFYLITKKFVLTLPYHLLKKITPMDDFPISKNYKNMN